jgi:hypothetical protein
MRPVSKRTLPPSLKRIYRYFNIKFYTTEPKIEKMRKIPNFRPQNPKKEVFYVYMMGENGRFFSRASE